MKPEPLTNGPVEKKNQESGAKLGFFPLRIN